MNYAIVEKNSNRAIAVVDDALCVWFAQNFPVYDQKKINSVGSCSFVTTKGNISTISIQPVGTSFSKEQYHMITRKPDDISLGEAYELIKQ